MDGSTQGDWVARTFPSPTQRGALRVVLSIGKNARMMRNDIYHITPGMLA
jgi:hypothetical protein